ncbi:uncharacterized protein LOC135168885 [Diachasmimorpha longicaudata]|uniref:uncharacterized protein LOC135168885 n=1 Tax=Diachasmimorpha longicaudata TaxID=58733 RepID=UPI0030B8D282
MWSEQKRESRSSVLPRKTNLRLVPKTKWEGPRQKPKSYWKDVFEDLDTNRLKVNQPLLSLFPSSLGIPIESGVSIRDEVLAKSETPDVKAKFIMNEPIVKISPPSPSHNGTEGRCTSECSFRC